LIADTYNSALRELKLASHEAADFDAGGEFTCVDPICIPLRVTVGNSDRILLGDTGKPSNRGIPALQENVSHVGAMIWSRRRGME
jgi:hypothetical protein